MDLPVGLPIKLPETKVMSLEELESWYIGIAIDTKRGNLAAIAQALGIAKATLYIKIGKYGLHDRVKAARKGKQ